MRIGILGSGLMGGKLAREAGKKARAGTPREAAEDADALLLAVHWSRVNDVLRKAGDLSGKVIVSCSLPMNRDDTRLVVARTSGRGGVGQEGSQGRYRLRFRHGSE